MSATPVGGITPNGGGAFVLIYLAAIALVALPALIAEFLVGRRGAASVVFVEKSAIAAKQLRCNIEVLDAHGATVLQQDALDFLGTLGPLPEVLATG